MIFWDALLSVSQIWTPKELNRLQMHMSKEHYYKFLVVNMQINKKEL